MITPWRSIIAILSVLVSSSAAPCQWVTQDSGVSTYLSDVCFVDTLHGWAVGDSATIIATTDGGETWQRQESPVERIAFKKVQFVNENVGYIVGPFATILSTKNGGTTWVLSESGIESTFSYNDLSFVNEDKGWVACGDAQPKRRGVILHTGNGGQTWEKQLDTDSLGTWRIFTAVAFLDEENGWVFGGYYMDNFDDTEVYHTSDGGQNWNIVGHTVNSLWEISVVSEDTIWGGGLGFEKSFNGGVDWEREFPMYVNAYDIAQINGRSGWVISDSWKVENKVLFTEDAGETWREILVNEGPFGAIANVGRNYLWVVGKSGAIMHYTEQTVSVSKERNQLPHGFELEQNYPNPFNPITTITYSIKKPSHVVLEIYAINGQKVATLVDSRVEAGTHSVRFDGSSLASGVYFYRFNSPEFKKTGKMLMVR